jgi:hypothetical protein
MRTRERAKRDPANRSEQEIDQQLAIHMPQQQVADAGQQGQGMACAMSVPTNELPFNLIG